MLRLLAAAPVVLLVTACGPGPASQQHTQSQPDPLTACSGLDEAACEASSACQVQRPACPTCTDSDCGPCPAFSCVPVPPQGACAELSIDACGLRSDCRVEDPCPMTCTSDGQCSACDATPSCVDADPCAALDTAACSADSRCELIGWACPAICQDDGRGGCVPCTTPPPSCRTREEPPVAGCGSGGSQPPAGP